MRTSATVEDLILRIRTMGAAGAASEVRGTEKAIGGLGSTARKAAGIAGVGAIAFGLEDVTSSAIKFQAQTALLANALKNVGQYSQENMKRIVEAADTLATHGGFDPATSIAGMQRLVTATGSVGEAIKQETLVTDLSRAMHIDYTAALRAVINVENGRTTGLARLGLQQVKVTTAVDHLREAHKKLTPEMLKVAQEQDKHASKLATLQLLWHRFGGATEAYSKSAAGAANNFRNSVEVLGQRIGVILLPVIMKVVQVLTKAVEWLGKNKLALDALLIAIGAVTAAWVAANLAFLATPIGAIVAGIVAITAGIVLLITHFKEVKKWIQGHEWALAILAVMTPLGTVIATVILVANHFKDIKRVATDVFNAVKSVVLTVFNTIKPVVVGFWHVATTAATTWWSVMKGIFTPFRIMVMAAFNILKPFIVTFWHVIERAAELWWSAMKGIYSVFWTVTKTLFNAIKTVEVTLWKPIIDTLIPVVKWVGQRIGDIFGFVVNLGKKIGGIGSGLWHGLTSGLTSAINWIIGRLNDLIDAYNSVAGSIPFFGGSLKVGHIALIGQQSQQNQSVRANWAGVFAAQGVGLHALPGRAHGGPIARSGMYMVGEQGPERVFLPAGSGVQPSSEMPLENHVALHIDGREFAKVMAYSLTKAKATS